MKEKIIQNKKIILIVVALFLIAAIVGITYSWYTHLEEGENQQIIAGDIHLTFVDGNDQISITNVFPESLEEARDSTLHVENGTTDNTMTFTITGNNESNKTLYYEILLSHGDEVNNKYRYEDLDLRFDLAEIDSNGDIISYLVQNRSYGTLDKTRIYVSSVAAGTSVNKRYMVRMWVSDDILISDSDPNANYPATGTYAYDQHYGSVRVGVYGDFVQKGTTELYTTLVNANPTLDTNVNFLQTSVANGTDGLFKMASTASKTYPILYYRGELSDATINNNVYFAGFCWRIVRTTDTGGVKIIYNGLNTGTESAPVCNNTGADTALPKSTFNTLENSPVYVGYMYGTVYTRVLGNTATGDDAVNDDSYFGTDFEYGDFDSNGTSEYRLKSDNAKIGIDATHHYSCNSMSITETCTTIRYYYYWGTNSGTMYKNYIKLTNGKSVEDALDEMMQNTTNSTAKTTIDTWYASNMTNYTSMLEDTIWCNDRSIQALGGWNPKGGSLTSNLIFNGVARQNSGTLNLECPNKKDALTVNNNKGNKMLTYPVALLTIDEIILAGGRPDENMTYYLQTGINWRILSPYYFRIYSAYLFYISSAGMAGYNPAPYSYYLRPAVSLKPGITILGGDGDTTNPYIIG